MMASGSEKIYSLKKPSVFMLSLFVSFVLIFGLACIVTHNFYKKAIHQTIHSNETRANLLAKLILEHQRAAIGVLRAYARRPLLIESAKRKDFQEATGHLTDLVKNNPEMGWAFISNPDSTVWANFPADMQVMNKDLSYRDWYKGVSREWKPYISSVYKMIVGEKDLAVAVCVPMFDEKEKVIGILSTAQSTTFFRKIISDVGLNLDANITLIDQEGHIIYSNRFPYMKDIIAYPPVEFVSKAMKGGRGDIETQDASDRGRVKYVSFAPVEGIGWSVIVEKAKSDVLRSELAFLLQTGIISLLAFTVILLGLVYLRGKFSQMAAMKTLNEQLAMTNEQCVTEIGERKRTEETLHQTEKQLRLISAQRLTAQEQERKRIAGEMHDSIGAALSAIKFKVDCTIQQMEQGTAASESLKGLLPTVQQAIDESRRIQANLRPSILDDLGILPTIEWQCREYQGMYPHIRVEKRIDLIENQVPEFLKTVIYRIVQEGLNNIAKHGKADRVTLSLQNTGDSMELVIQDNGQGFDSKETPAKGESKRGFGLTSMRERAELSGGSFAIRSTKGKGTMIRVSWPLNERF